MTRKKERITAGIKKVACRKFTLRDNGGVLSEVETILKNAFPKPSLNSFILEAIQDKIKKQSK